jgi:hypothetical protein
MSLANPENLCPICGHDALDPVARATARALCRSAHVTSEYVNPGGRELTFAGRGRIQLSDYCYVCDLRALQAFLGDTAPEASS